MLKKIYLPILMAVTIAACNQADDVANDNASNETTPAPIAQSATTTATTAVETPASSTTQYESSLPASAPSYTLFVDHSYPPLSLKDEYGKVTGFEVDVLRAAGEEAGFKVNAIPVPWDGIFDSLTSENADVVGGVAVTPERLETYEMTTPHIVTDLVFAYRGEDRAIEDIMSSKISAQEHTSFISTLRDMPQIDDSQIVGHPTSFLAFRDMLTGKVDAVFNNRAILLYQLNSLNDQSITNDVTLTSIPDSEDVVIAFAIKKGNTRILNNINEGLEKISANGKLDEIEKKWFNTSEL